jgi:hypothetical protein
MRIKYQTMYIYQPVDPQDHDSLLGKNFATRFANEMTAYYAPFVTKGRAIQIAKETWEYAVSDSILGAQWVGAGKNVVDVRAPKLDIDVKGLSTAYISRSLTTEASYLQNNKVENDGFASLFKKQDFQSLKTMFVDPLQTKLKDTNNLHLLAIVREKTSGDVYYTLLKVVSSSLSDKEFVSQMKLDAGRSVSIPMIDPAYGKTYLYIPKRRLEIRLNCSGLKDYLVFTHTSKN